MTEPRRREQRGWYVYDWANSTFSTTVATVFLGPYLTAVAKDAAGSDRFVSFLGLPIRYSAWFPAVVTFSVLLQVLVLPLVGAAADRSDRKRRLLGVFAYVGAIATMLLALVREGNFLAGGLLFVTANVAFGASIVVYNSFLPEISRPDERDAVSSRGWAAGYLGGALLLLANLVLLTSRRDLGLTEGEAVRICLFSAGAWWAVFTLVPLRLLRSRPATDRDAVGDAGPLTAGFRQLRGTLSGLRDYPQTLLFLVGFLLYNDGIQAAISFSATFGSEELDLSQETLVSGILLVQFVAFLGALALGRLAGRIGARRTIMGTLVVWMLVVAWAAVMPAGQVGLFYGLAAAIGIVLGGSQALSRSLFSQFIPRGREAEYFGLYEISDRATSLFGSLLITVTLQITGSYRLAIVALVVFFAAGLLILVRVRVAEGIRAAGNQVPTVV